MADRDDFVILHSPVDRAWADWIVWQLEQSWFTATVRAWDAGTKPLDELLAWAADAADRVLVVCSESMMGALARDTRSAAALVPALSDRRRVVAAIVRPSRLPDGVALEAPIELAGLDEETAHGALLEGVRRGRPVAKPEPGRLDEGIRGSTRQAPYPGARAPVFRALAGRAAVSADRDHLHAALEAALARGPVVLAPARAYEDGWGLTALAREHAYRKSGAHSVVWWVRAWDPMVLETDLAALAHALGLPERAGKMQATVVDAVRRWLATHDGWLLVLDGAVDQAAALKWLPGHAGGQVLITSSIPEWPGSVQVLEVGPLELAEAVRFVTHRCAPVDADGAAELVALTEGQPLALHLACGAAALLSRSPLQVMPELRALIERGRATPSIGDSAPLHACVRLALDALRERRPAAAEMVRVAAWLAPEEIPLKLFETSVPYLAPELSGALGDHDSLHDMIHLGERAGLIEEVAEDHVSLHPAVARMIRAGLPAEARASTCRSASALVCYGGSFFFHDGSGWQQAARWLPHAQAVLKHVLSEGQVTRQTLELARHLGDTRANAGRLDDAVEIAQAALAIAEKLEGPQSREASRCVSELAWLQGRRGDRVARRRLLARALAIAEAAGAEPREVGDCLVELAAEHQAGGRDDEALPLLERAAQTLGTQPDAAVVHRRLAELRARRGDSAGAEIARAEADRLDELFGH